MYIGSLTTFLQIGAHTYLVLNTTSANWFIEMKDLAPPSSNIYNESSSTL
jgi:hypothetical protein